MPAWATVATTLGANLIAVLGTLAATKLQLRHGQSEREAAERAHWREKGAEVVAPLRSLIDDANPLVLALDREGWKERMESLWGRWAPLRDQLAVLGAAHPSPAIGKTVAEIMTAVPQALANATWLVGYFVAPTGPKEGYAEAQSAAKASNQRAAELATELLAEVRAFALRDVGPEERARRGWRERLRARLYARP